MNATSDLQRAGAEQADATLHRLNSSATGLTTEEARRRLEEIGPNAVTHHGVQPLAVFLRQLGNPLLILLGVATATAFAFGERSDALIILVVVSLSVGLGFINEYRSERAVAELHNRIRHMGLVTPDGKLASIDVTQIVPGDVVTLNVGDIVPADHQPGLRRGRRHHSVHASRSALWLSSAADRVLRDPRRHGGELLGPRGAWKAGFFARSRRTRSSADRTDRQRRISRVRTRWSASQ